VKFLNRVTHRGWIPAGAVAFILAMSALAPSPTFGSTDTVGYGYMHHNCGVKGDGTHDHGKACPNRPFPGKGHGVIKATSPGTSTDEIQTGSNDETAETTTTSTSVGASTGSGKLHGHGHGKGHGHGRGQTEG